MSRVAWGAIGALVGVAVVAFALLVYDEQAAPPIVIEDPRPDATIAVSVEGAVATPGVYALRGDARVNDALAAAGGTVAGADLSRVNLAQRLRDEERVIVPGRAPTRVAGPNSAKAEGAAGAPAPRPSQVTADHLVNINTASAAELEALPRIGTTLAQRIVAYRDEHGPFRTVDELAEVKGISAATVDQLRPLISVGP